MTTSIYIIYNGPLLEVTIDNFSQTKETLCIEKADGSLFQDNKLKALIMSNWHLRRDSCVDDSRLCVFYSTFDGTYVWVPNKENELVVRNIRVCVWDISVDHVGDNSLQHPPHFVQKGDRSQRWCGVHILFCPVSGLGPDLLIWTLLGILLFWGKVRGACSRFR